MSSGFTNECNVVTIFDMGVTCLTINAPSQSSSNGAASLIITGGTPPYTITWSNNNTGQNIYNLTPGNYTATIIDSYGDFTATASCEVGFDPEPITLFNDVDNFFETELSVIPEMALEPFSIDVSNELSFSYSINQPACGCDGGLVIFASGGYPPYSFSLTNNLSTQNFPLYENLCQGNYLITVNDVSGNSVTNSVTLNQPSNPTTYNIFLNTTENIISNTTNTIIKNYTTTFSIVPDLPSEVSINFDFIHSNISNFSPNWSVSTISNETTYIKNGIELPPSTLVSNTASTINISPGCQLENIYVSSSTQTWYSLSISSSDIISITTLSTINKIESIDCYESSSVDSFSIINTSISGCSCCNVINST